MRVSSIGSAILSLTLLGSLAACSSTEQTIAENYAAALAEVGDTMMQEGSKVETLFAIQAQPLSWTEEQRDMWNGIETAITEAAATLESTPPPAELTDANTALIAAIKELGGGMQDLNAVLDNPTTATPEQLAAIMERVSKAEEAINEPLATIEAFYEEHYGDQE